MTRTRKPRRNATATDVAARIAGLAAQKLFQTAVPLASPRQLASQHLDLLQMSDVGVHTRLCLGEALDAIRAGDYANSAVVRCFEAYNQRCGR